MWSFGTQIFIASALIMIKQTDIGLENYPKLLKAGVLEKLEGLRVGQVRTLPLISILMPAR